MKPAMTGSQTLTVSDRLGLTSSRDVLESISNGDGPEICLMALGYAGWGAGQLDQEMRQNAWLSVAADHRILFDEAPAARWSQGPHSRSVLTLLGLLGMRVTREPHYPWL
ncbi:MAG: hypothetical protein CM1200mP41_27520 [Gammaproteobacteria bacterium]|nr:MAG: hypothetical protein CM1200mP41_27520 [Gammaproteobacteria bacterium]